MDTPTTVTPKSDISIAIETLRLGQRLPYSLVIALREQGYDIVGLHAAYLNKKV